MGHFGFGPLFIIFSVCFNGSFFQNSTVCLLFLRVIELPFYFIVILLTPFKYRDRNCNSLVQPVVLFGSQTWKMTEGDNKKIDVFQSKCLRRIYKVHCPYIISNDELLKRGQTQRWSEVVRQRR